MSLHPCDFASGLSHSYYVASSLCFSVSCPTTVPHIHGLPYSHCTATSEPVGKKRCFSWVSTSLLTWDCLFISTVWLFSSLSHTMDGLLNLGSMPVDSLFNRRVASPLSPAYLL